MRNRALVAALVVVTFACGGKTPPPSPPPTDLGSAAVQPDVPPPPPAQPVDPKLAMWPDVKTGTLPNGLRYYVLKNKKPDNRALLWLAVNAGSVQEDDDQRGLAHFVEHMAFNGTAKFPKHAIIDIIEKAGMRFGADLNAYTSWDETVYQLEVPVDDPVHLDKGLDVLREWSEHVTMDPKEVDLERGVVLEEWRLGLGAGRRLFDKHVKVVFQGSRYADRITIGLADTLRNAPRDALYRYYKDWYRPDLMAVIVVGDFADPAAIERAITSRFGDLKGPAKPRARIRGELPKADGTRISIETDKEQTSQSVSVSNLVAHRPEATRGDYRRSLVEQLYSAIANERFRTIARRQEAPFIGAFARVGGTTREIDELSRSATVKAGRVEDSLRALFTEVLRIEQHGFTQAELDRARTNALRRMDQMATDAPTARSRGYADELKRNFLEGEFVLGPVAEAALGKELLPEITLAELNQLAKGFGGAENRVITISGPDDKPLPTKERVLAIVSEVEKSRPEPWVEKAPPSQLMATTPQPGTIVKETTNAKLGTTTWTLSNGVRVTVKPTDFDADAILLSGTSPGGLNLASAKLYPHARFADTIAALGGVGELDTEDLGRVLTGKQASASVSINETSESASGRASSRDLETMFQLLYLRFTAPRKDEAQIALWRDNTKERLVNLEKSPEYQYSVQSNDVLWKNHPRRKRTTPAELDRLDPEQALAFYKDRFGDATDFTFTIVGTVDLAKLRPLVETYLGGLPAKGRKEKEKDIGIRRAAGVVKKAWSLGQEPKAQVAMTFHGDEKWTRDRERDMYILSRALSNVLRNVMREDKGGVYGVGAGGFLTRGPHQERVFSINFGADPARVDELIATAKEQLALVAKEGVKPEILDKLKKQYERERETQLESNGFWLAWLETSARYGDDPELILDPAPMLARMTNANVRAAAKRYLDGKRYYQSMMLPGGTQAANDNQPARPVRPKPPKDTKTIPGAEKGPNDKIVPGAEKP